MRAFAKGAIKGALRRLGYAVHREGAVPAPEPDVWPWLRASQGIATLIDIGANTGDFGSFLAGYFGVKATYAFEPLPSCLPALRAKSEGIPNLHVFDVALSDEAGEAVFYANSYPPSSSLLRVGTVSKTEFPETDGETPVRVRTARLDDLLDPAGLDRNIFIKIDVQGYEDRVIRGGWRVFSAAQCVLAEMSFVPMYEGQPLFEEVHDLLVRLGFRFGGIRNQISSRQSGQPLFAHCLYVRAAPPQRQPGP